jgi:integrase
MWHLRTWTPAREAIGLPSLGFHDLRRFYATQLVEGGVDIKVSQELMGHEDITLTRGLYAQAGDDLKQRANDEIATRLLGTRDKRAMEAE